MVASNMEPFFVSSSASSISSAAPLPSPPQSMTSSPTKGPKVYKPSLIIRVIRAFYLFIIELLANFVADILEHPRVQNAAAQAIVAGMNATTEQEDLPQKAAELYLRLQQENEHISRQLGEQFPKVAANFIAGAASSFRLPGTPGRDQQRRKSTTDEETVSAAKDKEGDKKLADQWQEFVDKFKKKDIEKKEIPRSNSPLLIPLLGGSSSKKNSHSMPSSSTSSPSRSQRKKILKKPSDLSSSERDSIRGIENFFLLSNFGDDKENDSVMDGNGTEEIGRTYTKPLKSE